MLPSHLFSMFCRIVACLGDCGQSRCPPVWAALPHVPSHIGGMVLPTSKKVRKGWEFSVPLVEKAGLRKLKLLFFFFFCRRVSISKTLSSEEICQPSDGISGRDQEEMARLEYQVPPPAGNSPGMWKIKVQA